MTNHDDGPPPRPEEVRNGAGQIVRTPAQVERDAYAAELRGQGMSYDAIAKQLGVSKSNAWESVQRAFRDTLKEPADQARAVELARLEAAHDAAMNVLTRQHVTVSHGRIIVDDDGQPLLDDGPVLQAIDRLVRLSESRRKLLGLDAPSRVSVDAEHLGQEIGDLLTALAESAAGDDTSA